MAPKLPHASFNSSRFIRLLAELTNAEVAASDQSLVERLGLWMDWADAISLSAALNSASSTTARTGTPAAAAQATRVRAELSQAIAADGAFAAANDAADFSPYGQSYAAHQRSMEARIGPLRAQVRTALGQTSAELGRLAALDAVMDKVLSVRERSLLASVPGWLEKRFTRLRDAHADGDGAATWRIGYGRDVQAVLLAELDIRLQPVDGLIAALADETTTRQP